MVATQPGLCCSDALRPRQRASRKWDLTPAIERTRQRPPRGMNSIPDVVRLSSGIRQALGRHYVTLATRFKEDALEVVRQHVEHLRQTLSFADALSLREADAQDILVTGKEVQLTVYRQTNVPFLTGRVLITVQLARHGLGGVVAHHIERGLVFSPGAATRDATDQELLDSAG